MSKIGSSIRPVADPETHHSPSPLETDQPSPGDAPPKGSATFRLPEIDLIVFDSDPPNATANWITSLTTGNLDNSVTQPQEEQHHIHPKNGCVIMETEGELITICPPQ